MGNMKIGHTVRIYLIAVTCWFVIEGSNPTWFEGCFTKDTLTGVLVHEVRGTNTHISCAKSCLYMGYGHVAIQSTDQWECICVNGTIGNEHISPCCNNSVHGLPISSLPDCWAVFVTLGPYLTDILIDTDDSVVVVSQPVAIEINVIRASAVNVSSDNHLLGHDLDIYWRIRGEDAVFHHNMNMEDFTKIIHRPRYTFNDIGNYTVDVKVSNGISTLLASLNLQVVWPSPHDLQVGITNNYYEPPSCIPEEFKVMDRTKQVLAVFINTPVQLEASVSRGTNLTFIYKFEDDDEVSAIEVCNVCKRAVVSHTFTTRGIVIVNITVSNFYGTLNATVILLVVDTKPGNLTIDIEPKFRYVAPVGAQLSFIVSIVTTKRTNRFLLVSYGDGQSNVVSLEDTKSPKLVLTGNGKEMEIIANYGDGSCTLMLEFTYIYKSQGLYRPIVALFDVDYFNNASNGNEVNSYLYPDTNVLPAKYPKNKFTSTKHVYSFFQNETYYGAFNNNPDWDSVLENIMVLNVLEEDISVLPELQGLTINCHRIIACYENAEFALNISSVWNVTMRWIVYRVSDEADFAAVNSYQDASNFQQLAYNKEMVYDVKSSETRLITNFSRIGEYVVRVTVENVLSSTEASRQFVVQCPVEGLQLSCLEEYVITGSELECHALVEQGSHVVFNWKIIGESDSANFVHYGNYSSTIKQQLTEAGSYKISVEASNDVSMKAIRDNLDILVIDPLKRITVLKDLHNLVGEESQFSVWFYSDQFHCKHIMLEFSFEDGNIIVPGIHGNGKCYAQITYTFATLGQHNVTVYAHNYVHDMSEEVVVWVHSKLANISCEVVTTPIVGSPVKFIVQENGKTMATESVYFTWKFQEDVIYNTNSPIVEAIFNFTGNYIVLLNAFNPVSFVTLEIHVHVQPQAEICLILVHDLYILRGDDVNFELQTSSQVPGSWHSIHVHYSDDVLDSYSTGIYKWSHTFQGLGLQQINVTIVDMLGTSLESLTSYVMVQEPITGLKLSGPQVLPYQLLRCTWHASTETGTNIMYRWTLQGSDERPFMAPTSEFEQLMPKPGVYIVHVEAFNDVTAPVSASLQVIVQNYLHAAQLNIVGNLLGRETDIQVGFDCCGSYVTVDFGDGDYDEVLLLDFDTSFQNVSFSHIYRSPGEFAVTINVSNDVDFVLLKELFVPIVNVSIVTKSPWIIRSPGHVVVMATVEGGSDVNFIWNFSDTSGETIIRSFPNKTSIAWHRYSVAGVYQVSINVTGKHYPLPGIHQMLAYKFNVIDAIDGLKISTNQNFSVLEGLTTEPVEFTARSLGSHITFVFDYGDGTMEEVIGSSLFPANTPMVMFVEVIHKYAEVGEFEVRVTARNQLGNQTVKLPQPFLVQRPPHNLYICEEGETSRKDFRYIFKVGEEKCLCANVTSGTNVTFDWKFRDQTDLVKTGGVVCHMYMSPGLKMVYVIARNKVKHLQRAVNVSVNYEIQGVELIVESRIVAIGQDMIYTAIVTPGYPNIASKFLWTFNSPNKWSRNVPRKQFPITTQQHFVSYKFVEPGLCTASVTALSDIRNVSSATIDIQVYGNITGLQFLVVGDKTERLVNRTIRIKSNIRLGTDVNLTWVFGDGCPEIITNQSEVEHVFTSQGVYNISVTAKNPVSTQTMSKMLFVLEQSYCNEPYVKVLSHTDSKDHPNDITLKFTFSKPIAIEADVKTDCNITSAVNFYWSVDGHMTYAKEMRRRVLMLAPRTLAIGLHSLNFTVKMVDTFVYATALTTINVIPSALVSKIKGGIYRHVKAKDYLELDGSHSFDPDTPRHATFSFSWFCHFMTSPGHHGDMCFHLNDTANSCNTVAMNKPLLKIPLPCLVPSDNYTFELTVHKNGRQNETTFQVVTLEHHLEDVLDVKIIQPYSLSGPINADRKLSFYVECTNCPASGTNYVWSLQHLADYNIHSLVRAHDLPCVDPNGNTYYAMTAANDTYDTLTGVPHEDGTEQIDTVENYVTFEPTRDYIDGDNVQSTTSSDVFMWDIQEGKTGRKKRSVADASTESPALSDYIVVEESVGNTGRMKSPRQQLEIRENNWNFRSGSLNKVEVLQEDRPDVSRHNKNSILNAKEEYAPKRGTSRHRDDDYSRKRAFEMEIVRLGTYKDKHKKVTILDKPTRQTELPEDKTRTGLNNKSLVIKPGFLRQGLTYIVAVKVTVQGSEWAGEAKSSFLVNESPVHGKCSIKPEVGVGMQTDFSVLCQEWKDEHQPLMYEVSYIIDSAEPPLLIYRGLNPEFTFKLPAGKGDNHVVNVVIDILDALLAKTRVCSIPIQVRPERTADGIDGVHSGFPASIFRHDEVASLKGAIQQAVAKGDDSVAKVYIGYLATWMNNLNTLTNATADIIEHLNVTLNFTNKGLTKAVHPLGDLETRIELLQILKDLPVRDEAEIMQSAQALAYITAQPNQLNITSLYLSLKILKAISAASVNIYQNDVLPTGSLIPLVVQSSSSIIEATTGMAREGVEKVRFAYEHIIMEAVDVLKDMILNELQYHLVWEEPIKSYTDFLSTFAMRHNYATGFNYQQLSIKTTHLKRSRGLNYLLGNDFSEGNGQEDTCFQSHVTTFKKNPYAFSEKDQVSSTVIEVSLYDCTGHSITLDNLPPDNIVHVDLPNNPPQVSEVTSFVLKKWAMNVHQFNVTLSNLQHALHLVVELVPVDMGNLFPLTVLISFRKPPSPEQFNNRYDIEPGQEVLDIFMPVGTFNETGMCYIGIVDSTYNAGKLRPGEVTQRNYTLKLWWGQCVHWSTEKQLWLPDGCDISRNSTFEMTKCMCDRLTTFGGRFDLVKSKLSLTDVEVFFGPPRNPTTLILITIVIVIYCVLLIWGCHRDRHDNRKGGIVYLLDNSPMDQQKYEIVVETGFWRGAGTTAKISIILHGEEGMSETRELISEDDRPMFERNSRDKFILTLPDSIGRIWKVQIWHNNYGLSPSWYLNRVIIRDLNTGSQYLFLCEKWLAVEEQDGKVEREFMVQDGPLDFKKAYMAKAVEYLADFHIWISILTCPPYSGFMRAERLSTCLTMLMMYMCLNAIWYEMAVTEYRGEFGLLDLSWESVSVGAVSCAVAVPIGRLIEFLFRRSKPKHASNCQAKHDVNDWEPDYPSGKPNEQEIDDSSEHVPPVMTYSLLDQSILNWPNIQTWAQKQWMKRQQTARLNHDCKSNSDLSKGHGVASGILKTAIHESELIALHKPGLSELDQASSGFEDCSSLIRPKASVDSTHTMAAPSVNESVRVHKPQSLPDSLGISTKPASEVNSINTSKAPSISSSGSNKSSVLPDKKKNCPCSHMYLPFWCRYLAWTLCTVVCVGCCTVTIMCGYRFGITKSTLWLQSLYFSVIICLFLANPLLVLMAVCYTAYSYKQDPTNVDSYSYDIFNHEKAKKDLKQRKTQMDDWDDGDALERGVAARQRSRYLRFARPPQEKQLIEARKKVMKEKKALSVLQESLFFTISTTLLMVMAYGKDTLPAYNLNVATKNLFTRTNSFSFNNISSHEDWYTWVEMSLLPVVGAIQKLNAKHIVDHSNENMYMIGQAQLWQQRLQEINCSSLLPYVYKSCLGNVLSKDSGTFGDITGLLYKDGHLSNFAFGRDRIYGDSGYVIALNNSRSAAHEQIFLLRNANWLDRQTRAVFVEMTLYNAAANLFTMVQLLVEMTITGSVLPVIKVTSTQLFRYVSMWDSILLTSELLFFVFTMMSVKRAAQQIVSHKWMDFLTFWNIINLLMTMISVVFCVCYIYRFVIVSDLVEELRSTFYQKYINVSFITFWDQLLRSSVAILLFLSFLKCLRLLRFNRMFAMFGDVYRRARREIITAFAMFSIVLAAYSCLGHILFGAISLTFVDLWRSLFGVTTLLTGCWYIHADNQGPAQQTSANVFIFTLCVFGIGIITCYVVAVLMHFFSMRRKWRVLSMDAMETVLFYWDQFQLAIGVKHPRIEDEPIVILPLEFTMAEIEYQVDELLFRMNALTGSHGLPEKPACYLTDSDCTYGAGDDGISSGGSEPGQVFPDCRLEQRVQKIEDNLYSQEPFLAQLLKLDSSGAEDLYQEREKLLRSHLELEIFRQLQMQRQDLKSPLVVEDGINRANDSNHINQEARPPLVLKTAYHTGQESTSSVESTQNHVSDVTPTRPKYTRSNTAGAQASSHDAVDSLNENSSSSPDSPRDKLAFANVQKNSEKFKLNNKQHSLSSSEKISPDLSSSHAHHCPETENIKKPTKPTFLHSRESSLLDCPKGSPIMKMRIPGSDVHAVGPESSSGSEQDGLQVGKKLMLKRSLRKTKSRGKGKGADGIDQGLILDEMEGEEIESWKVEEPCNNLKIETVPVQPARMAKIDGNECVVTADIHYN